MTASLPARPQGWTSTAANGCTARDCGTQDTVTLSHIGRRCAQHPPAFDPNTAVELMVDGWPHTSLAYVRTWV